MASAPFLAHAADKPDPKQPWWVRCKTPLSPEIEAALAEATAKMVPLRKKDIAGHMDGVLANLIETTGLADETKKKALAEAVAIALDETMKPWPRAVTETNRIRITANGAIPTVAAVKTWNLELQAVARLVLGCKLPDEQPAWAAALKANLSAEQLAKWEKVVAEKRKKRDEDIAGVLKQWEFNYREGGTQLLVMRITAMTKELKLDDERTRQLREAATAVVDRICKAEVAHATEALRFEIEQRRQETLARSRGMFTGYEMEMNPAEDSEWLAAVKRIVKPDELAKWERHLAEEKAAFEKEIPTLLKPALDQMTTFWKAGIEMETNNVVATLGLSPERVKALEPAAKAALERAEKTYMRLAREQLDKVDSAYRAQILKRGSYYVRMEDNELPQNDASFKEAVLQLLTPEEKKKLTAAQDERKARRVRVMGRIMVAELDKKVAFTTSQREKMQPIAERLVKDLEELFPPHKANYSYDFDRQKFFAAATMVKDDELKSILDPVQLARWREACKAPENDPRRFNNGIPTASTASKEPQKKPEPEEIEIRVSEYLHKKTLTERKELLEVMILQAEDAARVVALPADVTARLQTAARGAVEREMSSWRENTERNLRSNIQGATPANIKQRLASMEGYYYERRNPKAASSQELWKKALAAKLNDTQRAVWQKETDARKDHHWGMVASAVLAEFDRRHMLTTEQWGKLEPLLTKVVTDYSEDIENYFSGGNSTPWYLQTYSTLLPIAGVPEKELKAILSKTQWDRWSGEDLGNAMNYWENIEQNHKSRVKQAK